MKFCEKNFTPHLFTSPQRSLSFFSNFSNFQVNDPFIESLIELFLVVIKRSSCVFSYLSDSEGANPGKYLLEDLV
jgi:hypothetical protein